MSQDQSTSSLASIPYLAFTLALVACGADRGDVGDAGRDDAEADHAPPDSGRPQDAGEPPVPAPAEHRAQAMECSVERADAGPPAPCDADPEQCSGRNAIFCTFPGGIGNRCFEDECTVDEDCAPQDSDLSLPPRPVTVCACDFGTAGRNRCLHGNCRTDADCGANGYCTYGIADCEPGFFCRTPDDECLGHEDCPAGSKCDYLPGAGHWGCSQGCADSYL
jgi:hypothetical protein